MDAGGMGTESDRIDQSWVIALTTRLLAIRSGKD